MFRGLAQIADFANRRLPPAARNRAARLYAFASTLVVRRIPIMLLRGVTVSGAEGAMLWAGKMPLDLPSRFFEGTPRRETVAEVPAYGLEGALAKLEDRAELAVVCADRFSSQLFFGDAFMAAPVWVGGMLDVRAAPTAPASAGHSVAEDLRVVRREGLEIGISRLDADFDRFYDNYYVPFTLRRHDEAAHVTPRDLLRSRFRGGGIVWVLQRGERIAGLQFGRTSSVLQLWAIGTRDGAPEPVRAGAFAALYRHAIELARETGLSHIDFGGSRPFLNDGLLRYKRKWGVRIAENRRNHDELLIKVNRWNRNVTSFLAGTPLIYRVDDGFAGLAAMDSDGPATQADADRLHRQLWSNGLKKLTIVSADGWECGAAAGPFVQFAG